MSAFLGPIHYWLYNKIQIEDKMVEAILSLNSEKNYVEALDEKTAEECGILEKKPLEEMIDETNIHGWLQHKVNIVESRLGFSVTEILKGNPEAKKDVLAAVYALGCEVAKEKGSALQSAEEGYKRLEDMLLDGMPCDHVNELVSASSDEVVYRRRICIHDAYWSSIGGDVDNYYRIRSKFIEGFLADTAFSYSADEEGNYHIKRK